MLIKLRHLGNCHIVCIKQFHEVADSGVCLFLGCGFDVHDELCGAFCEGGNGKSGWHGVTREFCVRYRGCIEGNSPHDGCVYRVYVGVVCCNVVDIEFVGDVVFCLRFVLCLSGVGDEGMGWGVVNVGHFIEVVDEVFECGVVVGEGDGGFYSVGGIFSHAFYYTSITLFVNNVLWLYEINHMRFSTSNLHRKSLNRARPTRPTCSDVSLTG